MSVRLFPHAAYAFQMSQKGPVHLKGLEARHLQLLSDRFGVLPAQGQHCENGMQVPLACHTCCSFCYHACASSASTTAQN